MTVKLKSHFKFKSKTNNNLIMNIVVDSFAVIFV